MTCFRLGIYVWLLVVMAGCSSRLSPNGGLNQLRVMTYNIHHANPPSKAGVIDLDTIAAVIKKQQPDLVALQEVDVHTRRSGSDVNQATALAKMLNMKLFFAKTIDHDGGDYGIAILSRFPILDTIVYRLPTLAATKGEPRALAVAKIKLPSKKEIYFACTHLDAQKPDTNRLLQIRAIDSIFSEQSLPVIIGGDFNAPPSGKVIAILDSKFTRTCVDGCGFTIPEVNPVKTIDFLAYKSASHFSVIEHRVIAEPYASDHLPVIAVLKVK